MATRDSRRGSASTRSPHRRRTAVRWSIPPDKLELPADVAPSARQIRACPPQRSHNHHSVTTTGAILCTEQPRQSQRHISRWSTCESELPHRARLMARKGSAKLFWQPTQEAGEGRGDHTGDAEPGTGPGLGRKQEQPARAPLRPVLSSPTALQPRGANAANIACDPARRC